MKHTYLEGVDEARRAYFRDLCEAVRTNLPAGFEEQEGPYGINFCVPLSLYPSGYHCDPKQPLPFITLAAQKSHLALYHMGIYAKPDLLEWFVHAYTERCGRKPDMGKSCIRLKKYEQIPYALIGELCAKMNPQEWISCYEQAFKR